MATSFVPATSRPSRNSFPTGTSPSPKASPGGRKFAGRSGTSRASRCSWMPRRACSCRGSTWSPGGDQRLRRSADQPAIGAQPARIDRPFASLAEAGQTGWDIEFEASIPIGFRNAHSQERNFSCGLPGPGGPRRPGARHQPRNSQRVSSARSIVRSRPIGPQSPHRRRRAVQAYKAQYELRGTTADPLLRAQQSLVQAEVSYDQAIIQYNQAITDFYYRTGSILEESNITVAESLWGPKAYSDLRWRSVGSQSRRSQSVHAYRARRVRGAAGTADDFAAERTGKPPAVLAGIDGTAKCRPDDAGAVGESAQFAGPSNTPAPKSIPTPVPEPSHARRRARKNSRASGPQSAFGLGPNELPASGNTSRPWVRSCRPRTSRRNWQRRVARATPRTESRRLERLQPFSEAPAPTPMAAFVASASQMQPDSWSMPQVNRAQCRARRVHRAKRFRRPLRQLPTLRDACQPGSRQVASTTGRLSSRDEVVACGKARPGRARWAGTAACARIHSARRRSPG